MDPGNIISPDFQNKNQLPPNQFPQKNTTQPNNFQDQKFFDTSGTKTSKKKRTLFIFVLLFALLFSFIGGSTMVAYEVIPIKNEKVLDFSKRVVFSLPFIPKPPEYILLQTAKVHENVKSAYLNASFTLTSDSFVDILGNSDSLNLALVGPIDYSNPKKPKLDINLKMSKDIDVNLRYLEEEVYFKINTIPGILSGILAGYGEGLDISPLLGVWVRTEDTAIDTESEKILEEKNKEEKQEIDKEEEFVKRWARKIAQESQLESERLDENETYKITMNISSDTLEAMAKDWEDAVADPQTERYNFDSEVSFDLVEKFDLTFWVDKKSYLTRKIQFYVLLSDESRVSFGPASTADVEMAGVFKMDRFDEEFNISAPDDYLPLEEFVEKATKIFTNNLPFGPTHQLNNVRLAQAKSDIKSIGLATLGYYSRSKKLPNSVNDLVNEGLIPARMLVSIEEGKIKYKVSKNSQTALVYTLLRDPANQERPYYALLIKSNISQESENYSGEEINTLLVSLGLSRDEEIQEKGIINNNLEDLRENAFVLGFFDNLLGN